MSEDSGTRPNLRLIAGDLVKNLVHDVDAVVELATSGTRARIPRQGSATEDDSREEPAKGRRRIVIVGAGITGLAAAWSIAHDSGCDAEVIVYEADAEVGGKLKLDELAGITVDVGAECFLAVRPEALSLVRSVGLGKSIVHPVTTASAVVAGHDLRALPAGLMSGIPTDLRALAAADVMSLPGLLRIPLDHVLPRTPIDGDVCVGQYVGARLGREVVDRLVEPLLGGVFAGRADELSLDMAVPALFRGAKRERSLLAAANEVRKTGAAPSGARRGPVFGGISGGVGRLPLLLATKLRRLGVRIEVDTAITGLRRNEQGWRLLVTHDGQTVRLDADVVILAVPAPVASRLLRHASPTAASILDTVGYASVGLTTIAYDVKAVPEGLWGSGFLVPPVAGYSLTAATYESRKWDWVSQAGAGGGRGKTKRPGLFVVRASQGRYGEPQVLQCDDKELALRAVAELHLLAGLPRQPVAYKVSRWGGALPQYGVGHRSRIAQVRQLLVDTPGLSVCGAAYDGVGIAACVGSAQFAAGQVSAYLAERGQWLNG